MLGQAHGSFWQLMTSAGVEHCPSLALQATHGATQWLPALLADHPRILGIVVPPLNSVHSLHSCIRPRPWERAHLSLFGVCVSSAPTSPCVWDSLGRPGGLGCANPNRRPKGVGTKLLSPSQETMLKVIVQDLSSRGQHLELPNSSPSKVLEWFLTACASTILHMCRALQDNSVYLHVKYVTDTHTQRLHNGLGEDSECLKQLPSSWVGVLDQASSMQVLFTVLSSNTCFVYA